LRIQWRNESIRVGTLDRPDGGEISDSGTLCDLHPIHEPDRHVAAAVMPENVARSIAVEIASLSDRPAGSNRPDPRELRNLSAVQPVSQLGRSSIGVGTLARPDGGEISDPSNLGDLVPFMNQIATSPLVSCQRMSLKPLPSKSPVGAIVQLVATATSQRAA
jgi:hypothetical protein